MDLKRSSPAVSVKATSTSSLIRCLTKSALMVGGEPSSSNLSLEQREKYLIPGIAFSALLFLSVLGSLLFAGVLVAVQTAVEMKRMLRPTR